MEAVGEGGVQRFALDVVLPPIVESRVWSPMQRRRDNVVAALREVSVVVAARLHDIDFAGRRPGTISIFHRQHPDGRPEPIAGGELGLDFDTAVLDAGAGFGIEARGFDRVDDGAVGGVGEGDAIGPASAGAGSEFIEVEDVVGLDEVGVLEGGFDDEHAVLNEGVFVGIGCFLKLAVAISWLAGGT